MKNIFRYLFVMFMIFPCAVVRSQDMVQNFRTGPHAFDFWIGDWNISQNILQKDGSYIETKAMTSVSTILDGQALIEHRKGDVKFFRSGMKDVEPMKGFSLRYYDLDTKLWNIRWMDTFTKKLGEAYTGNFKEGKGEFFLERETKRGKSLNRITFSNIKRNSVDWDLAVSNDNGKTWNKIWIMHMTRR